MEKIYIIFHRGRGVIGRAISFWTLGKYAHSEFLYNGRIYLSNPGGVRDESYTYNPKKHDIYELDLNEESIGRLLAFFENHRGKGYDWKGILGQVILNSKYQDDNKYFCSEFCLAAIDYALGGGLTHNYKDLETVIGYGFNPQRLYKYLKKMELLGKKVDYADIEDYNESAFGTNNPEWEGGEDV